MLQQLRIATVMLIALTGLTGGLYPALVTVFARVAFPFQASGSLLRDGDRIVGSALIGQSFTQPEYFWGRPSATGPHPYHAGASTGSNYGPLHPDLLEAVHTRVAKLTAGSQPPRPVPVDLVTSSASGLDPHISPAAAEFQVDRVAQARHIPASVVRELVQRHTDGRQFGMLGEPRVHVLRLNLALDQLVPQR